MDSFLEKTPNSPSSRWLELIEIQKEKKKKHLSWTFFRLIRSNYFLQLDEYLGQFM